jgi:hypothetical protein
MFESGAWIIILEALLALVLGIVIVWFTVPRQVRNGDIHRQASDAPAPGTADGASGAPGNVRHDRTAG